MPADIALMAQSNAEVEAEMAAFVQEGGDTPGDDTPTFRSLSAASTVGVNGDGGDGDGDDVSMAGPEATNGEEDPGYASDGADTICYGADTEAMPMDV